MAAPLLEDNQAGTALFVPQRGARSIDAFGESWSERGAGRRIRDYHDVGVRCLKALLSAGVEVPLVVTTKDDPNETQWFASAAAMAAGLWADGGRAG